MTTQPTAIATETIIDPETGEVIAHPGELLDLITIQRIQCTFKNWRALVIVGD